MWGYFVICLYTVNLVRGYFVICLYTVNLVRGYFVICLYTVNLVKGYFVICLYTVNLVWGYFVIGFLCKKNSIEQQQKQYINDLSTSVLLKEKLLKMATFKYKSLLFLRFQISTFFFSLFTKHCLTWSTILSCFPVFQTSVN